MQGYSINGYLNAVRRRSAKTLMVEGITDSSVITRLKRSLGAATGQEPPGNVDLPGVLTDENLKGLGKREIVRRVLAAATSLAEKSPEIKRKFGTLQDREWDGLDLTLGLDALWMPPNQDCPHFVTVGHSIENYFFKVEIIDAYLRFSHSNDLNQGFFNDLHQRFGKIIILAAIYSIGVQSIFSIGKAGSLLTRGCVAWDGTKYTLTDALLPLLAQRGILHPARFLEDLNEQIQNSATDLATIEVPRWLCHGHLGEDAVWACVANLAREHNVSNEVAQSVERGSRDVRFKHASDYLSREEPTKISPLGDAVDWLTKP